MRPHSVQRAVRLDHTCPLPMGRPSFLRDIAALGAAIWGSQELSKYLQGESIAFGLDLVNGSPG